MDTPLIALGNYKSSVILYIFHSVTTNIILSGRKLCLHGYNGVLQMTIKL